MKIITYSLFLIIAGCSNPNAATKENFTKTIQEHLNNKYPICYFKGSFPTTTKKFDISGNNKILRALSKAKILSEKEISREEIEIFKKETIITYSYKLTDKGKKYYSSSKKGFCLGNAKITSINTFSEPAEMRGYKISRVNYSYIVTGFPEWAKNKEVSSSLRGLKNDIESNAKPRNETDVLILTNNGWIHEQLFKK